MASTVGIGGSAGVISRPELIERLTAASRIAEISAPPGSGKTVLLRSWIQTAGLTGRVGWVGEAGRWRDPQRFWISVADALGATAGGSVVRPLTPSPDLDPGLVVERLLEDLSSLRERTWLVIDDLHELRSTDTLRQLELFLIRSPRDLRFVLSTRHDVRVGLHRLRLEGDLTEIRAGDLRFNLEEARALFRSANVQLSDASVARLHARTEGWVAGLRLAALALVNHPDPERLAAEFSGTERTVAEYLLAEVLERQPQPVQRLLLRTSILDRVCGPLADYLTGDSGSERLFQELEDANAFIVALDAKRSWFRYHQLFAELLQLELRRIAPAEVPGLYIAASRWCHDNNYQVDAIRYAQSAEDWALASDLLLSEWFDLLLNGEAATANELLKRFPPTAIDANVELAPLSALMTWRGPLEEVERALATATERETSIPAERRRRLDVLLALVRVMVARQRGDHDTVVREATYLASDVAAASAGSRLREDMRAFALTNRATSEYWLDRFDDAQEHFDEVISLARQIERPYLEILGLTYSGLIARRRSFTLAEQRITQAIEIMERHGWNGDLISAHVYPALALNRIWQGQLEETDRLLSLGERALRVERQPLIGMSIYYTRGMLELTRGRAEEALVALQTAERLVRLLAITPYALIDRVHAFLLQTLIRLGRLDAVEQALEQLDAEVGDRSETRIVIAVLRLAQGDPQGAAEAIEPVLAGSVPEPSRGHWLIQVALLDAIAREQLGETVAAARALEKALDLAEPNGIVLPFLLHPVPEMLERHSRRTSHASLIAQIRNGGQSSSDGGAARLLGPLSESETRLLRYLPTNLSVPEIAAEVYLSVNTVKTHMRHIYEKLGSHRRAQAVERARALGLLAPGALRTMARIREP